jgi:ABC-2 type transport system ATP-binding protein
MDKTELLKMLNLQFPDVECKLKNENTIKIFSVNKIDISPIVHFISTENFFVREAKLLRPTLEDAFVKMTGIEIDLMKMEKEKK